MRRDVHAPSGERRAAAAPGGHAIDGDGPALSSGAQREGLVAGTGRAAGEVRRGAEGVGEPAEGHAEENRRGEALENILLFRSFRFKIKLSSEADLGDFFTC